VTVSGAVDANETPSLHALAFPKQAGKVSSGAPGEAQSCLAY